MKLLSLLVLCLLLVLTGCRTPRSRHPVDLNLSSDDLLLSDALAHYAQGLIHERELGRYSPKTLAAFAKAAELDPHEYELHSKLALAYLYSGDPSKAVETLENACRLNPSHVQARIDLATVAHISGRSDAATTHYRTAIKLAPKRTFLYYELARLLFHQKQDDEALDTLALAFRNVKSKDMLLLFCYNQGRRFLAAGELKRSIPCFQIVAKNVADEKLTPAFYLHHGAAYERSGKIKKSEEIFERCLEIYPDTHEVLNYLAYMWAEKGIHLDKALKYVSKALRQEPNNGAYIDTLGWIYFQQRRYKEALVHIQQANTLIHDDPTITDHLGDTFKALADDEKAIKYWKQSILVDPENDDVAHKLTDHGIDAKTMRQKAREARKAAAKDKAKEDTKEPAR